MNNFFIKIEHIGGAFSQLLNTVFFNGHPNESISARVWLLTQRHPESKLFKLMNRIINLIFFWEQNHTHKSHLNDYLWAKELINKQILTIRKKKSI